MTTFQIIKRGELKRRAAQANLLNKVMSLTTSQDDLEEIKILTLKTWLKEQAAEKAWKMTSTLEEVDNIIQYLQREEFKTAREFIEITENGIVIGVNVPFIDDWAIDRAILMLTQLSEFKFGRHEFGNEVTITNV